MRLSNIALAISVAYGAFNPASLFANGEQGAWYDPSDLTTLFQDSAGTTPVTGVEQFVGLMLDKSKGLVLGPELVTPAANRDFSSDTGYWTKTSGVTITGGQCVFTAVNTAFGFYRPSFATAGTYYEVTFTLTSVTAGGFRVYIGGNRGATVTAAGTYTQRIRTGSIDTDLYFEAANGPATLTLDDVSVKIVTGNHAFQTSTTKRPKLAARYNLLTYTEQFDNGNWLKYFVTISSNAGVAPDGTTTADLIYPTSTGSARSIYRGGFASISKTHSVAAKASGKNWFCIYDETTAAGAAWFNLATGAVGTVAAGFANATITSLGNGWYRCSVTSTSGFSQYMAFAPVDADNSTTLTANGTDGALIWGADLRPASQATGLIGPTYQRVVDAATYDTAGFLPYLEFLGAPASWSMETNSIDFSAVPTDKMTVWTGVRKLSDAALGIIAELSANSSANNGAFAVIHSNGGNNYNTRLRGTAEAWYNPSPFTAPITNVLSAQYDIGGAAVATEIIPRVNGVVVQTGAAGAADVGSGNFGNYPLFIGARNNASLFFNGWLTSLIIRGAQSTQSQIEATESWVAGKTGVSL